MQQIVDVKDRVTLVSSMRRLYARASGLRHLEVPEPTFSEAVLTEMRNQPVPRVPIFVHPEISKESLARWYPTGEKDWHTTLSEGTWGTLPNLRPRDQLSGWVFVESALSAPYQEAEKRVTSWLERHFVEVGALGLTIEAYAVFGLYCRQMIWWPDTKSICRLLGTVRKPRYANEESDIVGVVSADYLHYGNLTVNSNGSAEGWVIGLGARSAIPA